MTSCLAQVKSCFDTQTKEAPASVSLLKGDQYIINLDYYSTVSNLEYSVDAQKTDSTDEKDKAFVDVTPAFPPQGQVSKLTSTDEKLNPINKCIAKTRGLNEYEFVFLCDNTKIVTADVHRSNGSIAKSEAFSVTDLQDVTCHDILSSKVTHKVYTVCTKPNKDKAENTDILLYKTDIVLKQTSEPLIIKQDNAKQVIKKNLKLMVDDFSFDAGNDVVLYLWEKNSEDLKVRFRLIKDKSDVLVDGGYYSTENGSTKGLSDGRLLSVFHDGLSVLLTTRASNGTSFVQRCHRSPVYSKYMCHEETLTKLEDDSELVYYFPLKGTRYAQGAALLGVYSVSKANMKVGILDETGSKFEYKLVETTPISASKLKSISAAYYVNENFFIVGSTTDDSNMVDGVLKFKPNSNTFDDYNYKEFNPTLAMVVDDKLQNEFSYFVTVGEGSLSFYHIMYNHVIINTKGFGENLSSVKVDIKCKHPTEKVGGVLSFTVNTQMNVNDDPLFAVTTITSYAGAKHISVPTNGADISGNAPQISVESELGDKLTLRTNLVDKVTSAYKGTAVTGIIDHRHIGENVFAVWNANKADFFKCAKDKGTQNYQCNTVGKSIDFSKVATSVKFLSATCVDGIIVSVVSATKTDASEQKQDTATLITAFSVADSQDLFAPVTIKFGATHSLVRLDGKNINIVAIGSETWDQPQGIHTLKFKYDDSTLPTAFKKNIALPMHVCPTELWWAPKLSDTLYIASVCGETSLDNHVFSYNYHNGEVTTENAAIRIEGSRSFSICGQSHLINVIDRDQVTVFSYTHNPLANTNKKLNLPLHRYGLDTIIDHACDENAGLMQIIGCKTGEDKKPIECKVITYRGDEQKRPNRRVHSIIKVDPKFKRVETTYNDDDDESQMVLLGDSTADMELYTLESEGPHLELSALDVDTEKTLEIKWKVTYPGAEAKDDQTITVPETINLVAQKTTVNLVMNDSVKTIPDGTLVDLDKLANITGPYHSIVKKNTEGVTLVDRMSPSNQFATITQVFKDSILYKDYAFGTSTIGDLTDIVLVKDNKVLAKVENKPNIELFVIQKAESQIFFFAHSKQVLKKDELIVVFTRDGGATWKTDVKSLEFEGYKLSYIIEGFGDGFIFGGYNNRHSFSIDLKTFKINKEDKIEFSWNQNSPLSFNHPIADFDITYLMDTSSLIVIVGTEYSKEGHIYRYIMDDEWTLMLAGSIKAGLVPNVKATHKDIVFMCTEGPEDHVINCVHSGKNKNSYVTRFEFDFSNNGIVLKDSRIVAYLNNIVNLKPIKIDFAGDFLAVMVKNQNILKEGATPTHNSFFRDSYLCLIYKLDSRTFAAKESFDDVQVYKVLTTEDFGVKADADLSKLDPRFFMNKDGVMKLGVNVGDEKKSLKVFNLDPLSIIVPVGFAAKNGDTDLFELRGLTDKTTVVKTNHIFSTGTTPDPEAPKKKNNSLLLVIVIIASILVVVLIIVGIAKVKKEEETEADNLNLDDAEKTMKFNNDDSATGNYSKL